MITVRVKIRDAWNVFLVFHRQQYQFKVKQSVRTSNKVGTKHKERAHRTEFLLILLL